MAQKILRYEIRGDIKKEKGVVELLVPIVEGWGEEPPYPEIEVKETTLEELQTIIDQCQIALDTAIANLELAKLAEDKRDK